jgi:hypothetical protein
MGTVPIPLVQRFAYRGENEVHAKQRSPRSFEPTSSALDSGSRLLGGHGGRGGICTTAAGTSIHGTSAGSTLVGASGAIPSPSVLASPKRGNGFESAEYPVSASKNSDRSG